MNSFIGRLVLAYTVLLSVNAWSAEFTENFDGAVLTSSWQKSADAGYSFQNDGGLGAFSKVDLSPDGTIALTTTFQVLGDFAISVDVDARFGGPLSQGLNLGWIGSTSFAQIFFFRPQLTYQALGTSSASFSWNQRAASPQQVKFEIARVGTKVSLLVDRGQGGFEEFLSRTDAAFAGPVIAQLIVFDGDSGSNRAGVAYFDNFHIQAHALTPVPEPTSAALLLAGLAMIFHIATRKTAA